jgi:2-methylcitrate dehydratase
MAEFVASGLARLVGSIRYEDLSKEVVEQTKTLLLDSVGCLMGGFDGAPSAAARRVVQELGGNPAATVFGTKMRTTAPLAAFANGTALRYLDYNDGYHGHRDAAHPSGNIPVGLAVAEARKSSGKDLIAALVAAYEVHGRFADLAGAPNLKRRGWHNATNLQFSGAALAARLMGADVGVMANAIAISATHQSVLAQIQHGNIPSMKATNDGWIARGCIEAAMLAREGVTGPEEVFEGRAGWVSAVAGELDYAALLAPVKHPLKISETRIKLFAAVGPSAAAIQSAIDISQMGKLVPDDIEEIVVQLPDSIVSDPALGEDKRYPATKETADHSYHFLTVIALLEGACGPEQFREDKLTSSVVRSLLAKVRIESDPEFTALDKETRGAGVKIKLRNGTELEKRYPYPPGHRRNPLTRDQIFAKFVQQMTPAFGQEKTGRIQTTIENLEDLRDIGELAGLLIR